MTDDNKPTVEVPPGNDADHPVYADDFSVLRPSHFSMVRMRYHGASEDSFMVSFIESGYVPLINGRTHAVKPEFKISKSIEVPESFLKSMFDLYQELRSKSEEEGTKVDP